MPPSLGFKVQSNTKFVRKSLERLKGIPLRVSKNRLKEASKALQKRMQKPGKKVTYPIKWVSRKQQIKVIIMLRKKNNLPYKRTKKAQGSWALVEYRNGYGVTSKLKGGVAKFIYGDKTGNRQSSIHAGRWVVFRKEYEAVRKTLPKVIQGAMLAEVKQVVVTQAVRG